MAWTRKPQEQEGKYYFNGTFYLTAGVKQALSEEEIKAIYNDVQAFVKEKDGIDYLQVFTNEKGTKLFFIDQLDKTMIESGEYPSAFNHCTLMFAHEY